MPPRAAYQIIHDELNLDGNPALNLASFVTTWMEPEADMLMTESFGRNYVDADEYPKRPKSTTVASTCWPGCSTRPNKMRPSVAPPWGRPRRYTWPAWR